MSNTVTIKIGEHYFNIPMHEYSRHWLNKFDKITVPYLPNELPKVTIREGDKWD